MLAGIQRGVMTAISLSAVQGLGMHSNQIEGESTTPIQVNAAALLDAPSLGVPRKMMEHVLESVRAQTCPLKEQVAYPKAAGIPA